MRCNSRPYKVVVIESERGWGQKVIDTKFFTGATAEKEAEAYALDINKDNVSETVPDYYIKATVEPC